MSYMEAKYLTWNFANFVTVNLMVVVLGAILVLVMRYSGIAKPAATGGN